MAVRIRRSGEIVCAALSAEQPGDTYIDDGFHYHLSAVEKVLVTTRMPEHVQTGGVWYWKSQVPVEVVIDPFYLS